MVHVSFLATKSSFVKQLIVELGSNLGQYCNAILDQGFSRIPSGEAAPKGELSYRGSVEVHHRLLASSAEVIGALHESSLLQNLSKKRINGLSHLKP